MKKRIGNDITFTWHIYRKSGESQTPESFAGKEVEVKLISPLQRPVTIEDVSIATGVVTFTFRGKHQVTLGNYVAVLLENKGENGMVTLDVVSAVTLVPHSYMEEDGDEGDVIEASSVELESSISVGGGGGIEQQQADWEQTDETAVDFIKNKPDLDVYCLKDADNTHSDSSDTYVKRVYYEQGALRQLDRLTVSGDSIKFYHSHRGEDSKELLLQLDDVEKIKRTATTELDGLMSAADKQKITAIEDVIPEQASSSNKLVDKNSLASVATSGSYNDLSDKPDLSSFITRSVDDLTNYYLKSETYTKTEVQQLISAIQQFHYEVYPTLPQTGASNVLYLIGPTGTGTDKYEEYVYANNDWTKIGDTSIDLSGYVTTQALTTALADYVTSSALSTALAGKQNTINDLAAIRSGASAGATAYQKPSTGIPAIDLASDVQNDIAAIDGIEEVIPAQASSDNKLADKNFVNSSIATNTANYISDNGQPFQSVEDLEAYSGVLTNNDYAFVVGVDSVGNTTYSRYKYNASTQQWALEYVLNNSSFTAEQWAAINSSITSGLVAKLSDLPTNSELATLLNGKASKESLEEVIRKAFMDAYNSEIITDSDDMKHFILSGTGTLADSGLYTTSRYAYIDTFTRTIGGVTYDKTIELSGFSSYPTFYIHCPFGGQLYLPILTDNYARFTIVGHHINEQYESGFVGTIEVDAGEDISITHTGKEKRIFIGEIKLTYKDYLERTATITLLNNKVDKVAGKGLSTNDYTDNDKDKLTALPTAVELLQQLGNKANTADLAPVATSGSYNDLSDTPTIPDITGKADKVSNATNGNFAALDSNGNLVDSGHKHSDYLTQHQDLTNYVQKSQTTGLLKNDGTVDTNQYLTQHQDISGKENVTTIVTPVNATDATLPITTLTCEVGKYYRIDVAVDTLGVTLPAMTDLTTVRTVVICLTADTTSAVTITAADNKDVYYQDGFKIEAGSIYEINALFNGAAWIVAAVKINVE